MNFIDKTIKYLGYFTAFISAMLVLVIVYDATARYLFSSGSVALQELERYLFDIVILFGIAYALRENVHVRVDIFYASFSKKKAAFIDMISMIFFVLPLSFLIIYIGVEFVYASFIQNEASSNPGGFTHLFLLKALMPLSFIFLLLQALREALISYNIWRSA